MSSIIHTLYIATGTTPSGVLKQVLRKLVLEKRKLEALLRSKYHSHIYQQLLQLQTNIDLLALDIDATNIYQTHQPLEDPCPDWPINTHRIISLPGRHTLERAKRGFDPQGQELNPVALQAIEGSANASGGTPPTAHAAFGFQRDLIRQTFTRKIETFMKCSREQSSGSKEEGINVVLLGSTFGGFSSGTLKSIITMLLDIADDKQLQLKIICILMVPGGTNTSKDIENSRGVNHGMLKELSAIATGFHRHREISVNGDHVLGRPTRAVDFIFMSDTNNAMGDPKGLSIPDFTGMVAELAYQFGTSPLGARLRAATPDFKVKARGPAQTGEPLTAAAAGISTIYLGRERLQAFMVTQLKVRVLQQLLMSVAPDLIRQTVERWVEGFSFLEGKGVTVLSTYLLEQPTEAGDLFTPARWWSLAQRNLSGLTSISLLTEASQRMELAAQQTGELEIALPQRQEALLDKAEQGLDTRLVQLLRDPLYGLLGAQQFLETLQRLINHLHQQAIQDNGTFEDAVQQHQATVDYYQTHTLSRVQGWPRLIQSFRKRQIQKHAARYMDSLRRYHLAIFRRDGHFAAVEILGDLLTRIEPYLLQVKEAVDATQALLHEQEGHLEAIGNYDSKFETPNGFCLYGSRQILEEKYHDSLPQGEESRAVQDVYHRLLQLQDLWSVFTDGPSLSAELDHRIIPTFQSTVDALHVVEEVHNRFPNPEDLGAFLKERERESIEYLQLKDSVDREHGTHRICLLGLDQARSRQIPELLDTYGYSNRQSFEVVDTKDPDRIVLLQYRAVFSYKDLAHYEEGLQAYRRITERTDFEKLHTCPGARWLPTPGQVLIPLQAQTLLIKAWILNSIHSGPPISLMAANQKIALEEAIQVLMGKRGYDMAVDVVSRFNCFYRAQGPKVIQERMDFLRSVQEDSASSPEVERKVAGFFTSEVEAELNKELSWWDRNTIPTAMSWFNDLAA